MMETMIPPQVGMRLWTMREKKRKKEKKGKKGKRKKEKGKEIEKRKKREKGHCYYPLPHLCFKVAP